EDEIMLITRGGQIIRSPVKDVRVAGRNTQGVKLMNLEMGDLITAVARVVPDDTEGEEGADEGGDDSAPDAQLELSEEE
ncbi:MAG TPA: DNA gyrase C-terminal beta-propeller domain-containing protein, partial [Gemmatimonadaceae bacterium]